MMERPAYPPEPCRPIEGPDEVSFELGFDGIWRAFDCHGLVAHAPTWRELFERTGGRWN